MAHLLLPPHFQKLFLSSCIGIKYITIYRQTTASFVKQTYFSKFLWQNSVIFGYGFTLSMEMQLA